MIFNENCLLADNSHEISYLIFFRKLGKMSQNLSAAVVIGALRVIMELQSMISMWNLFFCCKAAFKDRRLRFSPKLNKISLLNVQCKIA